MARFRALSRRTSLARRSSGSLEVSLPLRRPQRLLLGSDAYTWVRAALSERLAAVEAQKDVAYSTNIDGFPHVES